jgi:hypothetical protein
VWGGLWLLCRQTGDRAGFDLQHHGDGWCATVGTIPLRQEFVSSRQEASCEDRGYQS